MKDIIISLRAYNSMLCELSEFSKLETGGILLGKLIDDSYYIVEAIDAGINTFKTTYKVKCDSNYLTHMSKTLSRIYNPKLDVIGLWHKHNNNMNPPFSNEDSLSHHNLLKKFEMDNLVSVLFQKEDYEKYIMKVYCYDDSGEFTLLDFEIKEIGDVIKYLYI